MGSCRTELAACSHADDAALCQLDWYLFQGAANATHDTAAASSTPVPAEAEQLEASAAPPELEAEQLEEPPPPAPLAAAPRFVPDLEIPEDGYPKHLALSTSAPTSAP